MSPLVTEGDTLCQKVSPFKITEIRRIFFCPKVTLLTKFYQPLFSHQIERNLHHLVFSKVTKCTVYKLNRLCRLYCLCRMYRVYRLDILNRLFSLCRLYWLYQLYRLRRLYRLNRLYRLYKLSIHDKLTTLQALLAIYIYWLMKNFHRIYNNKKSVTFQNYKIT